MTGRRPPSWALVVYYGFLLFTTGLAYGSPYPLFGAMITGRGGRVAVVLDCLVLLHILIGVWKAQRLTWYLLLAYNGFELASLAVTLLRLNAAKMALLTGGEVSAAAVQASAFLMGGAMVAITLYAARLRPAFSNRNPFLF